MDNMILGFAENDLRYDLEMIFVEGTHGEPYLFGEPGVPVKINIGDFFISKFPVTELFFKLITGFDSNPSDPYMGNGNKPVRFVSWNDINGNGGFLEKINSLKRGSFRLPSETEWEYAARGGKHWKDNFIFSGGNDINQVGWYQLNSNDEVKEVGLKAPNQLGIYEMNGNVWEWCEDTYQNDYRMIPKDGSPYRGEGEECLLRGGCHHNWAIHCTVFKRYAIGREFKDNCISFRLALPASGIYLGDSDLDLRI